MNRTRIVLACVLLVLFIACAIPLGKQIADAYTVRSSNLKELEYVESLNDKILLLRGIREVTAEIETLKKEEAALDRDLERIKDEIDTYENRIDQLKKNIRRYEDAPVLPDREYIPPAEFIYQETNGTDDENEEENPSGSDAKTEQEP